MIIFYKKIGIKKFTPGWFTSDAIENLFSCVRRVRSLPSCKEFSQQIRTEVVKRFTEITLKSSYDQDESFEYSQLSFLEYLKSIENDPQPQEEVSKEVLDKLEKLNEDIIQQDFNIDNMSAFYNDLEINTFFYVCGYLLKKLFKKVTCEKCAEIMIDKDPVPHRFNKLVRLRSKEINYQFFEPSANVFQFLVKLENLFLELCNLELDCTNVNFKTIFVNLAMNAISLSNEHCEFITEMLVENFIGLRVYMTRVQRDKARRSKHSSNSMR